MSPPNFVGLLCLRAAKAGGTSHIVSFMAAHNALRDNNPDLLKRLYAPFYFDRQREHASDDAMSAPGMDVSFQFEPGQIQILNNRVIGHRRTGFTD